MNEADYTTPTTWLWKEIEARFGKEAADQLHQDHNRQLSLYAQRHNLKDYQRRLPGMRWQLSQRRKEGRGVLALEKSIALYEQRLREAGMDIPTAEVPWQQEKGVDA